MDCASPGEATQFPGSKAQVALLVGMVKGPSLFNPRRHPERAKARRDLVIGMLAEQGMVSEAQAEKAVKSAAAQGAG